MFCPKCGTNVPEGSKFCEICGNNLQHAEQIIQEETVVQQAAAQEPAVQEQPQEEPQPAYQAQPQTPPPPIKPQTQATPYQPQPQANSYQPQTSTYQAQPAPAYQPQPQAQAYKPQPAPAYNSNTFGGADPREKVYGVGGWLLTYLVLMIPLVNIVMIFVWAFSGKVNKNKKNWAIATLIMFLIGLILSIVLSASIIPLISSLFNGGWNYDF